MPAITMSGVSDRFVHHLLLVFLRTVMSKSTIRRKECRGGLVVRADLAYGDGWHVGCILNMGTFVSEGVSTFLLLACIVSFLENYVRLFGGVVGELSSWRRSSAFEQLRALLGTGEVY